MIVTTTERASSVRGVPSRSTVLSFRFAGLGDEEIAFGQRGARFPQVAPEQSVATCRNAVPQSSRDPDPPCAAQEHR